MAASAFATKLYSSANYLVSGLSVQKVVVELVQDSGIDIYNGLCLKFEFVWIHIEKTWKILYIQHRDIYHLFKSLNLSE